jgi:beta-1,4-mannosyltransferase
MNRDPVKVLFLPNLSPENPYQQRLAQAVAPYGVDVQLGNFAVGFPILGAINKWGKPHILHLHWAGGALARESLIKSLVLPGRFLGELLAVRARGIKLVWTVHNIWSHERQIMGERFINHILVRLCHYVIVHSSFGPAAVREAYRLPAQVVEKIHVIPHGHYMDSYDNTVTRQKAREQLGLAADATVFLFFGQIRPYKGVPCLVKAFKAVTSPHAHLVIAGEPQNNYIEQELVRACDGEARIHLFLQNVPAEKIQVYMNASDVVVFPFQEIFTSGSALLAMSFGKAIIAARLRYLEEVLDSEGALFYHTEDELERILERALTVDLVEMGHRNRARAQTFDWETIGRRTSELYFQAINGGRQLRSSTP